MAPSLISPCPLPPLPLLSHRTSLIRSSFRTFFLLSIICSSPLLYYCPTMKFSRNTQSTTSIMRSDNSNIYVPTMSHRASSRQPVSSAASSSSSSSSQAPSGSANNFQRSSPLSLPPGSLPRFHPAIYQSPQNGSRSPSHASSGSSSRDALRHYRELIESNMMTPSGQQLSSASGPSAPRLDPLRSPGPVTPLTLEESSSYLGAGHSGSPSKSSESAAVSRQQNVSDTTTRK